MNTRRTIRMHLYFAAFISIALLIFSVTTYDNPTAHAVMAICCGLFMLFSISMTIAFARVFSKTWFKTEEELQKEVENTNTSWKKAEKFSKLIGQHIAIKAWIERDNEDGSGQYNPYHPILFGRWLLKNTNAEDIRSILELREKYDEYCEVVEKEKAEVKEKEEK